MLGIDTNVLVRLLVRDDALQFEQANALIQHQLAQSNPVLVSHLVLLETVWVLQSRYSINKGRLLAMMSALLDSNDILFQDEATVETALYLWKNTTIGFADCLIGSKYQRLGCHATATFDTKAVKLPCFVPTVNLPSN